MWLIATATLQQAGQSKYAKENIFKLYNENDGIINKAVLQSDESETDSDIIIEPEENRDLSAKLADIRNESLKVKQNQLKDSENSQRINTSKIYFCKIYKYLKKQALERRICSCY